METKLSLMDILLANGYQSVYAFAKAMKEDPCNMNKLFNGTNKYNLNIKKALKYGKALNLTLEETMWIFYPDYMRDFTGK